jgi:hypothetical protein
MAGTNFVSSNRKSKAFDAPGCERAAATSTLVSNTTFILKRFSKLAPSLGKRSDDIAADVTCLRLRSSTYSLNDGFTRRSDNIRIRRVRAERTRACEWCFQ